jgi:hypothetical protein
MWQKAFRLRQRIGDHAGIALSLARLAELALARNQVREAQRYLQKASNEAKASPDLIDDDKAFFFETQGWLANAEHHATAAVAAFQHALELVERSRGEQHWLAGWEHMLLGKAYAESGAHNPRSCARAEESEVLYCRTSVFPGIGSVRVARRGRANARSCRKSQQRLLWRSMCWM